MHRPAGFLRKRIGVALMLLALVVAFLPIGVFRSAEDLRKSERIALQRTAEEDLAKRGVAPGQVELAIADPAAWADRIERGPNADPEVVEIARRLAWRNGALDRGVSRWLGFYMRIRLTLAGIVAITGGVLFALGRKAARRSAGRLRSSRAR